ncbi:LysR family transcriptional regulator [Streptomyces hygroscopicus]|uniref:LysR family transcriptional regulator n=1 Tax=Streptomyces hygroscopicus TaxID=1912 RepID=UPI000784F012|nr:LysR family transcriptional regulator [Streptomyces hygroscopicus]
MDPTLQQLRVYLVVAEELHVGRAAARLHMTQPPVSRHLKALETSLGVRLVERSTRRMTLTPAGEVLRVEAETMLARWDRMVDQVRAEEAVRGHTLRLGSVEAVAVDALPKAIGLLRERCPEVEWDLREGQTAELLEELHTDRFDCVAVRGPVHTAPGISTAVIYDDELVAALPESHWLTGPEISLRSLADEDFIVYNRRARLGLLPAVLAACGQAGFAPRIRHDASGTELMLGLVAAGDGVALVSSTTARAPRSGVRFASLTGRPASSPILLAWRASMPDGLVTQLVDLLRSTALRQQ